MGLKPTFTKGQVQAYLEEQARRIGQAVLSRLQLVGESFVREAREVDTYKDRTGNLRSSIGFIILHNGRVVEQSFEGNGEGVREARSVTQDIASNYPSGFVLIVVAGMGYAAAVESKGFDVLTGSGQKAEEDLRRGLTRLMQSIQ